MKNSARHAKLLVTAIIIILLTNLSGCNSKNADQTTTNSNSPSQNSNSESTLTPEQTETPQYNLPMENELVQTYSEELSKITNSAISSCQYENYKKSDNTSDINVDAIINMSDGKTVKISCMYLTDYWSIISIMNNTNQHIYQMPEDFKFSEDLYDYETDKLIPKKNFRKNYTLKNMIFSFPSSWKKKKSDNGYTFSSSDALKRNMSILHSKVRSISIDELWENLKTNFSNYSQIEKEEIKIGGRKGIKWHFSFSTNDTNFEAIYSLIKDGSSIYCLAMMQPDFSLDDWLYNEILKTIKWKK